MILLVAWLWQGLAIAAATEILLRTHRRWSAATRHAIWWIALIAVASLPVAYAARAGSAGPATTGDVPVSASAVPLPAAPDWLTPILYGAWALVAFWGYLRIVRSVIAVRRLKRNSAALDPAHEARLVMWSATTHARRRAQVRVSPAVHGACTLGLGRPVILISPTLLQFDDDRLDAIVVHELAHVTRRDDWSQLLQGILTASCAFHPAVRLIGRRIHVEREAACDDVVVMRGTAVREYARSLTVIAHSAARIGWKSLAIPGAARSRSVLRLRVSRLMDPAAVRDHRVAVQPRLACAATMALAVGLSARTPALVEFIDTSVIAPPAARLVRMLLPTGPGVPAAYDGAMGGAMDRAPATSRMVVARIERPVPGEARGTELGPGAITLEPLATIGLAQAGHYALGSAPADHDTLGSAEAGKLVPVPAEAGHSDLGQKESAGGLTSPGSTSNSPAETGTWSSLARSATNVGQAAGRVGAGTGSGARNAGASIGRFFGKAGKAIAGNF